MNISSEEQVVESHDDEFPLLMELCNTDVDEVLVIDVERSGDTSSSGSSNFEFSRDSTRSHNSGSMSSMQTPLSGSSPTSFSRANTRNSSVTRRIEDIGHRNLSPFNSVLWISIELTLTLIQIMASLTVLYLSKNEHPRAPLFAWVVGYTAGCFANLPVVYWHFLNRNQNTEQGAGQATQVSHHVNSGSGQSSYVTISLSPSSGQEDHPGVVGSVYEGQTMGVADVRIALIMDHFKMALDCFFAVWFVVGNIWIFGGHASVAEAPNLYRLCIVYLTLSCIGYAMPFILCAMICCCLPCIISVLGTREELSQGRRASEQEINALPTSKFKVKKGDDGGIGEPGSEEGGIVAAGTDKERFICKEDAVCCICLARYVNDDELRDLPCSHFFHSECVDRWLKINATCPLCKSDIYGEEEEEALASPPVH